MEKIIFDEIHFIHRLISLKHYLFLNSDGSAYDSGYLDAINHVLAMMENN